MIMPRHEDTFSSYKDTFGRDTICEVLTYNDTIRFVIRRQRQVIYEAWSIETAEELIQDLQNAINLIKEKK